MQMEITNYLDTLETLALDEKTGISMLRLTKDESFSLYFAVIKHGTILPAHYHQNGIEAYQIIRGDGEFEIGAILSDKVKWGGAKTKIKAGDCFSVQPMQVHRLVNLGDTTMHIVFSTPPTHLGEDRFFITNTKEMKR
jgi:mannose-6-phosphate isomerase-like protein (cupin superfamily)